MRRELIIIVLLVLALIAALSGSYYLGQVSGKATCEAAQAKANEAPRAKQKAATQATVNRGAVKGAQHERDRVALDKLFQQLETEQNHAPDDPVDACVLPAERLRIWRDANAGGAHQGATPSQPDSAPSAPAATGVGPDARPGVQPSGDSTGLSPAGFANVQPAGVSGDQA